MTDDDDRFFERIRGDAAPLRYQVSDATLARIRARIQERIAPRTTVSAVLAAWFRPLVAAAAIVAVAAGITFAAIESSDTPAFGDESVEIVMAGDTYLVGQ
jgi:hypothetical protein